MMKNIIASFIVLAITSCQTVKIKNNNYKVSKTTVELGSIGQDKKLVDLNNDFENKSLAKLENKIRLWVEILPFNKDLNKVYQHKKTLNQSLNVINYNDTLAQKPEFVLIRLYDVAGFTNELNADYNKDILSFLRETKEVKVVSSIAVLINKDDLVKIRQADSYYLVNNQEKRYSVQLYKQGKKTDLIDVSSATVLGYRLSSLCWANNNRGNWYVADLAEGSATCKGNTSREIKEKEEIKNLYKM